VQRLVSELGAAADSLAMAVPRVSRRAAQAGNHGPIGNSAQIAPMPEPELAWPVLMPWALAASLAVVSILFGPRPAIGPPIGRSAATVG